jgi:hypothetical protein
VVGDKGYVCITRHHNPHHHRHYAAVHVLNTLTSRFGAKSCDQVQAVFVFSFSTFVSV